MLQWFLLSKLFILSSSLLKLTQAFKFLLKLMDAIGDLLISWQEV